MRKVHTLAFLILALLLGHTTLARACGATPYNGFTIYTEEGLVLSAGGSPIVTLELPGAEIDGYWLSDNPAPAFSGNYVTQFTAITDSNAIDRITSGRAPAYWAMTWQTSPCPGYTIYDAVTDSVSISVQNSSTTTLICSPAPLIEADVNPTTVTTSTTRIYVLAQSGSWSNAYGPVKLEICDSSGNVYLAENAGWVSSTELTMDVVGHSIYGHMYVMVEQEQSNGSYAYVAAGAVDMEG